MKKLLALAAAALLISSPSFASTVYSVGNLSVSDLGTVDPSTYSTALTNAPNYVLSGSSTVVTGQYPGETAWNPWGTSDTTHSWVELSADNTAGTATFNVLKGNDILNFVWGSASDSNTVSFYTGHNGTGTLIGTVTTADLLAAQAAATAGFTNVGNNMNPGELISILTSVDFKSVVFSSGQEAFEFASVSAVPLPASASLFLLAMAGLMVYSYRRAQI
jgi:hypothetical protein